MAAVCQRQQIFWVRTFLGAAVIVAFIFSLMTSAWAAPVEEQTSQVDQNQVIENVMTKLDTGSLERIITEFNQANSEYLPSLNLRETLMNIIKGNFAFDFAAIWRGLLKYLFHEVVANSHLLGQLIILSIICALLQNLQHGFAGGSVSKVAFTVCYLVMIALAIATLTTALNTGKETINNMVDLMMALLPILLTIMVSMGALTSAALFHPIVFTAVNALGNLVQYVVFPLIFLATVLVIVNHLSEHFKVSQLASLVKSTSIAILGFAFTIFLGVTSIYGVTASVSDGVSLRAAKFASSNFVPIIGKMFADALDVVAGCSLLLKNGLGLIGVIAILLICAFPAIKILSFVLIYKLAGALIQPVADTRIVNFLNSMGNSMIMVLVAIMVVGLMFFISVTIIVGAGNITMMMR